MRSAEVAGQINACRQSIYDCETEIQSLERAMGCAGQAESEAARREQKLEEELSGRTGRAASAENAGGGARLAGLYGFSMREDTGGRKMQGLVEYVADNRRRLAGELEALDGRIETERARLRRLHGDLADLQSQLQYWQNAEREEAQAAAGIYQH